MIDEICRERPADPEDVPGRMDGAGRKRVNT